MLPAAYRVTRPQGNLVPWTRRSTLMKGRKYEYNPSLCIDLLHRLCLSTHTSKQHNTVLPKNLFIFFIFKYFMNVQYFQKNKT